MLTLRKRSIAKFRASCPSSWRLSRFLIRRKCRSKLRLRSPQKYLRETRLASIPEERLLALLELLIETDQ